MTDAAVVAGGLFPVTVITGALRAMCGGPITRPLTEAAMWLAGPLAAAVPVMIARYRHATSS